MGWRGGVGFVVSSAKIVLVPADPPLMGAQSCGTLTGVPLPHVLSVEIVALPPEQLPSGPPHVQGLHPRSSVDEV